MFGLTPYERNDIWNPFRDFEKELFQRIWKCKPLSNRHKR